jgi:16S rRNA (uracil1498-N3)-methyltransferase
MIHLGLGISRGERMDLAIQKAVELGVAAITPLTTARSVVRLDSARRLARWEHWQRVAQSASEQCNRNIVPGIGAPCSLDEWLGESRDLKVLLDPSGVHSLNELATPSRDVALLSGPEGGFSEDERARALNAGFLAIRLGPRILRTETAAIAALAGMQVLWGDLSTCVE